MMKQRQKLKEYGNYKRIQKHSDSEEETELFVKRTNKPTKKEIPTVEKVLEEGDTLQSLSLRYNCTIEELKRLNNIHKENEIFAKLTIKVPHRPFTLALAGVHSGTISPNGSAQRSTSQKLDGDTLNSKLNETLVNLSNSSKDSEVNDIIFNSNVAPKCDEVVCQDTPEEDEEVRLLPQVETVPVEPVTTRLNCNGSDGDISLKALILCIVVLIFAVPLIYVFYIAEHPEQYHHQTS